VCSYLFPVSVLRALGLAVFLALLEEGLLELVGFHDDLAPPLPLDPRLLLQQQRVLAADQDGNSLICVHSDGKDGGMQRKGKHSPAPLPAEDALLPHGLRRRKDGPVVCRPAEDIVVEAATTEAPARDAVRHLLGAQDDAARVLAVSVRATVIGAERHAEAAGQVVLRDGGAEGRVGRGEAVAAAQAHARVPGWDVVDGRVEGLGRRRVLVVAEDGRDGVEGGGHGGQADLGVGGFGSDKSGCQGEVEAEYVPRRHERQRQGTLFGRCLLPPAFGGKLFLPALPFVL
jgi:hypothetical protein